jgi:hypothetical protein
LIPLDRRAHRGETAGERGELLRRDEQRWMSLARRRKLAIDADVQLLIADREPHSTPTTERLRLLELGQAQERSVEMASFGLAPGRCGDLHMVEADDWHPAILVELASAPVSRGGREGSGPSSVVGATCSNAHFSLRECDLGV